MEGETGIKRVMGVEHAGAAHWVGDGFPVRSFFSHGAAPERLSPFLMLDYAPPTRFPPAAAPRGVGEHPHRGFETVTIVYQGELEHRDSTGAGGRIGAGDVQWMTAGAGILHEELHSTAFTRDGGTLEMAQLWVNLPASSKRAPPGYQTLLATDIPVVPLAGGAGTARVIAGELAGRRGPARTFSPIEVWDLRLVRDGKATLEVTEGHAVVVVVFHGTVLVNGSGVVRGGQWAALDRAGTGFMLEANGEATVLVLAGRPLDEPVVGYGPFVMNTRDEIREAIDDFNGGRFGRMAPSPPRG